MKRSLLITLGCLFAALNSQAQKTHQNVFYHDGYVVTVTDSVRDSSHVDEIMQKIDTIQDSNIRINKLEELQEVIKKKPKR